MASLQDVKLKKAGLLTSLSAVTSPILEKTPLSVVTSPVFESKEESKVLSKDLLSKLLSTHCRSNYLLLLLLLLLSIASVFLFLPFSFPLRLAIASSSTSSSSASSSKSVKALTASTLPDLAALAERFVPEFIFHTNEPYFPLSLDLLIDGGTLHGVDAQGAPYTKANPTQSDLANSDGSSTLTLKPNITLSSGLKGTAWSSLAQGPIYYSTQVASDYSYIYIHYVVLYRFNGAQTIRSVDGTDFIFEHAAEHDGDLEQVSVLVGGDQLDEIQAVRFEAHGDSAWFRTENINFTQATHPQVRVALNSHAMYNGFNQPLSYGYPLTNYGAAKGVDLTTDQAGFSLLNVFTQQLLTWPKTNNAALSVAPASQSDVNANNSWTPNCPVTPQNTSPVILQASGSQCMTVLSGTTVGIHTRDDSAADKWLFIFDSQTGDVVIQSQVSGGLVLTQGSDGSIRVAALDGTSPLNAGQVWRIQKLGIRWRPWTLTNGLRMIGLDDQRQLRSGSEAWALYLGRLGSFQTNKVDGGSSIDGHALTPTEAAEAAVITAVLQADFQANPSDAEGSPAEAPGARTGYPGNVLSPSMPYPVNSSDVYVRIIPGIPALNPLGVLPCVLSITSQTTSSDPHAIVVRRQVTGDMSQLWRKHELSATNTAFILYNAATGEVLSLPTGASAMSAYPAGCISLSGDCSIWAADAQPFPSTMYSLHKSGDTSSYWTVNGVTNPPTLTEFTVGMAAVSVTPLGWTIQIVQP